FADLTIVDSLPSPLPPPPESARSPSSGSSGPPVSPTFPASPTPTASSAPSPPPPPPSVRSAPVAKVPLALGMAVRRGDSRLYVVSRDGRVWALRGGRVDPQGDPDRNGQNLGVLLGKMLRIEPRMPDGSLPPGGRPYAIPPDNPFVHRTGARPEIWAYGLRNPWRWSFDRSTGDLWIGDVGGSGWEEVDFQPGGSRGGENYEWALREGDHTLKGGRPPGGVDPVYEYSHDGGGCVVTGGFVYRGSDIPALNGAYVFADCCLDVLTALV